MTAKHSHGITTLLLDVPLNLQDSSCYICPRCSLGHRVTISSATVVYNQLTKFDLTLVCMLVKILWQVDNQNCTAATNILSRSADYHDSATDMRRLKNVFWCQQFFFLRKSLLV